MAISLPFLRKYNYINDYFYNTYRLYAEEYVHAYPVTYYSIDTVNTVWDDENLMAGSYEKSQVGPLSGVRWRKIRFLPVFGMTPMTPVNNETGEEGGITYENSLETEISFPSIYGLKPLENDFVDLSFGFLSQKPIRKMLFKVGGINLAHQNDYYQIYQCKLQIAGTTTDSLEKQVSREFMFYEHDKIIVPYENGQLLTALQEKAVSAALTVNSLLDPKISVYVHS